MTPRLKLCNQRFGQLTVTQFEEMRKSHGYWRCVCNCGKTIITRGSSLTSGRQKSCGCSNRGSDSKLWQGHGEIHKYLFIRYRHGAKRRNIEFDITIEEMWNLFLEQDRKCTLTDVLLFFSKSFQDTTNRTASLDRKDSNKGYIAGNIQWVHKDINKMKMDLKNDYFIKLCKQVSEHN